MLQTVRLVGTLGDGHQASSGLYIPIGIADTQAETTILHFPETAGCDFDVFHLGGGFKSFKLFSPR